LPAPSRQRPRKSRASKVMCSIRKRRFVMLEAVLMGKLRFVKRLFRLAP